MGTPVRRRVRARQWPARQGAGTRGNRRSQPLRPMSPPRVRRRRSHSWPHLDGREEVPQRQHPSPRHAGDAREAVEHLLALATRPVAAHLAAGGEDEEDVERALRVVHGHSSVLRFQLLHRCGLITRSGTPPPVSPALRPAERRARGRLLSSIDCLLLRSGSARPRPLATAPCRDARRPARLRPWALLYMRPIAPSRPVSTNLDRSGAIVQYGAHENESRRARSAW